MKIEINLNSVLKVIIDNMVHGLTDFVPRSLTALAIILIGWLVAKIAQKVLQVILTRVRFDVLL